MFQEHPSVAECGFGGEKGKSNAMYASLVSVVIIFSFSEGIKVKAPEGRLFY